MKKPSAYQRLIKGTVPHNTQQELVITCSKYAMTVQDMVNFIEFNRIDAKEELISAFKAKQNQIMTNKDAHLICRYAPVTFAF